MNWIDLIEQPKFLNPIEPVARHDKLKRIGHLACSFSELNLGLTMILRCVNRFMVRPLLLRFV